jgi:hypothetical protein
MGLVLGAMMALTAAAEPLDVQATIDRQLSAFLEDDFETAFTFASPTLRRYFQTPENFRAMVTQGYPMVWRPGSVEYLDHRSEGGVVWQKVQITDQKGVTHLLEYRMIPMEGGWRISGVRILDMSDFSA